MARAELTPPCCGEWSCPVYEKYSTKPTPRTSVFLYSAIASRYFSTFCTEYNTRRPMVIRAPASSAIFLAVICPQESIAARPSISTHCQTAAALSFFCLSHLPHLLLYSFLHPSQLFLSRTFPKTLPFKLNRHTHLQQPVINPGMRCILRIL